MLSYSSVYPCPTTEWKYHGFAQCRHSWCGTPAMSTLVSWPHKICKWLWQIRWFFDDGLKQRRQHLGVTMTHVPNNCKILHISFFFLYFNLCKSSFIVNNLLRTHVNLLGGGGGYCNPKRCAVEKPLYVINSKHLFTSMYRNLGMSYE